MQFMQKNKQRDRATRYVNCNHVSCYIMQCIGLLHVIVSFLLVLIFCLFICSFMYIATLFGE